MLEVADVKSRAERVRATSSVLRAMDDARVVRAIAEAARLLADPETALGASLREAAASATGLSPSMVSWGLRTTLREADESSLVRALDTLRHACGARLRPVPRRLAAIVLAGNVFVGGFRAVALPLLFRVPVIAKASTKDDVFVTFFRRALEDVDAELARSFDVLTFAGEEDALLDALLSLADVASVYGSDRTVGAIRARLSGTATLVAHGHGLGVAYVPKSALANEAETRRTLDELALDVAAYDQRGCLSPHAIVVEPGGSVAPNELARRLADESLAALARSMPRGSLPVAVGSQQVQWRGVAIARGTLHERDGFAVSFEDTDALRLSPGYRNVQVLAADLPMLVARLAPLGTHLKALGVAGDEHERARVLDALSPGVAPRVSRTGAMQTPPFDAAADGELPFTGFVRFADAD